MKLPELGVRRPVFTIMIFFSVLILGGISLFFLPIDLMPDIEQPAVSVITPYLGVSAEDIERLVTKEIENSVNQVAGVDKITSVTKDNLSVVSLEFEWGTDTDEAMNDIRTVLEFAKRSLPEDIETPQLFKFNTAQWPILFYCITASKSWPDLWTMADKKIADRLKTVPGVGTVRLIAGLRRQINVELDKDRLRAFNMPITQIGQMLALQNITITAGSLDMGRKNIPVRIPGEFEDPSEINDVIVGVGPEGGPVRVRDIARVVDGFNDQDEKVYLNKNPAILLLVMKQSGGNTVSVADSVINRIEEIQKSLPSDVKIVKLFDTSEFIKDAITNLETTILIGGVLVILVVYLFLRRFRSSMVIAMTIPFSLIIAFIFLYFFDYTINMMSLASLAIAVGMVVDTAIVILENITRHLEEGKSINRACVNGASEVGLAVTASAITTVVIFVPLLFISGVTGVMFKQLAFAIAATLFGSVFAGLMFSPMLASKLLAKDVKEGFTTERGKLGLYRRVEKIYLAIIDRALANRGKTILIALAAFGLSTFLLFATQTEFMPDEDTGDFSLFVELSPGTRVEESVVVGLRVMNIIMKNMVGSNGQQEWENVFMRTGQSRTGFATGIGEKEGDHIIECGARLIKRKLRTRSTQDYAELLRPMVERIPGVMKLDIRAGNPMQQFFGGGKPVQVEIKGADLMTTNKYAREIQSALRKNVEGLEDITVSRDFGRTSINVNIDKKRGTMMGLNVGMVAQQLRAALYGADVTEYRIEDDEYDIYLQLQESDRESIENLEQTPLVNLMQKTVSLANIARLEDDYTPIQIDRLDQERVVKVEANTAKGANLGNVASAVRKEMKEHPPPAGVVVNLGGQIEEMDDAFKQLTFVALLGMLLVYMVMASQFENFIDPFIIMFSIPFALVGVFLFVVITGLSFNLYTFLGIIMLLGIVVNNAIVYVDYANILRRRGMNLLEALKTAGKHRLRPILMTTFTTIFGMLPMALNRSEGAEFWRPLGTSVIGGLFLSGLVTLVLIPTIYMIIYSRLEKRGRGVRKEIALDETEQY